MYPANRKRSLKSVATPRCVLGVGRHIFRLFAIVLLLTSTIFPTPQKKRDPYINAQPGSKEEATVINNASRLFAWYTAFVARSPRVYELPLTLPDTGENDLFTPKEAQGRASKLPDWERDKITQFVDNQLRMIGRQTPVPQVWPGGTTVRQDDRKVFFINPWQGNPDDLIGRVVRSQHAALVQEGVSALVDYKVYKQNRDSLNSVPWGMRDFISTEYERLKKFVRPGERWKLNRVIVTVKDVSEEKKVFWMKACLDKSCREIQLSPLLARAMFMQVIRDDGDIVVSTNSLYLGRGGDPGLLQRGFDAATLERAEEHGGGLLRILRENPDPYNQVIEKFRESIDFPLAHEMAHIFLGDGTRKEEDDVLCDAAALELLKRANCKVANCKVGLGAFEKILNQAIEENREDLWDLEHQDKAVEALKQRFERLKKNINQ